QVLITAHRELAGVSGNPARYLSEESVRKDIRGVIEESLKRYPGGKCLRTHYALLAMQCNDPSEAHRQVQALGAEYWRPFFADEAEARETIDAVKAAAERSGEIRK